MGEREERRIGEGGHRGRGERDGDGWLREREMEGYREEDWAQLFTAEDSYLRGDERSWVEIGVRGRRRRG